MEDTQKEKFLCKEEMFIAVGVLLDATLKLENIDILFTPEESDGEDVELGNIHQGLLDLIALFAPHITHDEKLYVECKEYILERYNIEFEVGVGSDEEQQEKVMRRRPILTLVKTPEKNSSK